VVVQVQLVQMQVVELVVLVVLVFKLLLQDQQQLHLLVLEH